MDKCQWFVLGLLRSSLLDIPFETIDDDINWNKIYVICYKMGQ